MKQLNEIRHRVGDVPPELSRLLEKDLWTFATTEMFYFSDSDEDDGASEGTTTDGSSIHTPSTSHFAGQSHTLGATNSDDDLPEGRFDKFRPEPSELLNRYYKPAELDEYRALVLAHHNLNHLVSMEKQNTEYSKLDQKQHLDVLEIRSRRRAWLNKSLAGGGVMNFGLATPIRSSRLARVSWTCEDYEYAPEGLFDKHDDHLRMETERLSPIPKRTRVANNGTLFPVSEENEEEVAAEYNDDLQKEFEFDLEGGVRCSDADDDSEQRIRIALDIERSRNHPRIRTSSMYRPTPKAQVPDISPSPSMEPHPKSLFSQSYSPENPTQQVDSVTQGTPIYAHVEVNIGELEISGYGDFGHLASSSDEFTLAMDLPVKMRSQKRSKLPVNGGTTEPTHKGRESIRARPIAPKLESAVLTCR